MIIVIYGDWWKDLECCEVRYSININFAKKPELVAKHEQWGDNYLLPFLASWEKGDNVGEVEGTWWSLPGLQWFQPQASSSLCQDQATGNAVQID